MPLVAQGLYRMSPLCVGSDLSAFPVAKIGLAQLFAMHVHTLELFVSLLCF